MTACEIFIERLNELINDRCAAAHTNLNAISKEIGINQPTLFRYLKGEREPGIENLAKISNYFGVSADWLLGLKQYEEE